MIAVEKNKRLTEAQKLSLDKANEVIAYFEPILKSMPKGKGFQFSSFQKILCVHTYTEYLLNIIKGTWDKPFAHAYLQPLVDLKTIYEANNGNIDHILIQMKEQEEVDQHQNLVISDNDDSFAEIKEPNEHVEVKVENKTTIENRYAQYFNPNSGKIVSDDDLLNYRPSTPSVAVPTSKEAETKKTSENNKKHNNEKKESKRKANSSIGKFDASQQSLF